jgi:hypothetical protein
MRSRNWMLAAGVMVTGLTLMWPRWIEAWFGFDPDHQSGEAELGLVVGLGLVAISFGVLTRVARRAPWRQLASSRALRPGSPTLLA